MHLMTVCDNCGFAKHNFLSVCGKFYEMDFRGKGRFWWFEFLQ